MASKEKDLHQLQFALSDKEKPLSCAFEGQKCRICAIEGGCGLRNRLCAMGINNHSEIDVLKSEGHGPVIVGINDTRLALGRGMATKIIVETI